MDAAYTPSGRKTKELLISGCLAAQPLNCWRTIELILKVSQQLNLSNINLLINNTYSSWEHLLPTWAKTFRNWPEARNFPEARERQHRRQNTASHSPCVQDKTWFKMCLPQLPSQLFDHTYHLTCDCPNTSSRPVRAWNWHPKHHEMSSKRLLFRLANWHKKVSFQQISTCKYCPCQVILDHP